MNRSANHSVHLPWNYSTQNRNYISAANRAAYGTTGLNTNVPNPFQYLFCTYGLSVEGNYTFARFMDYSDAGGNAWIGNLGFAGAPQDLTNLRAEKSVSANDVPHRLAFAAIYEQAGESWPGIRQEI